MTSAKQILASIARKHLHVPTLEPRNSDSLDFHSVSVWSTEKALNAAFQAGAKSVRQARAGIDVHALLSDRQQVAVIWGTEDVQSVRSDLSDDRAWEVLQQCRRLHDCELGFNWLLIETVADDMFPAPDEGDGQ